MTTRLRICFRRLPLLLACFVLAAGCGDSASSGNGGITPPQADIVVDVDWLAGRLGDSKTQVVDARTQQSEFDAGHIPGAIRLDPLELAAEVDGVQAQIAPASVAGPLLRERGIRQGTTLVVYGKPPEFDPTRVAWALRYYGHDDVRYLDGGWAAWQASGGAVETGPSTPAPSDYQMGPAVDALRVTGDWVVDQLGAPPYDDPAIQLVDARSPEEFTAGRIPGAVHIQWTTNLEDGFFLPRADLEALHAGLDKKKTTVVYCLVGWRASFAWVTLELLGFEDVRVYDGSWLEWGAGGFPIETDGGVS